jgi:hypothetical protein
MNPEAPATNEAPVAPIVDTPAFKMPPLNRDIPLSQQTGKIMKMMENMPDKVEPKNDNKTDGTDVHTDKTNTVKTDDTSTTTTDNKNENQTFDEDDEDEPQVTPFEVKTWQEYVSSNIQPITIVGKVGDEVKEFKVFIEDQLPVDFQFNSDVDRMKYTRAFDRLERKAESLQQEFFNKQQQENIRQFEIQEAKDISTDLKWLQNHKIVPEFKYDETDSRFNSDPAVKEANEIYDLYKKINNDYAQKYMNTNRSFRISYKDAADKYYVNKMRNVPKDTQKPADKTPIQKQRDEIGGKVGSPQGGEAHTIKPRAFAGMSMSDINRLARAGKI